MTVACSRKVAMEMERSRELQDILGGRADEGRKGKRRHKYSSELRV